MDVHRLNTIGSIATTIWELGSIYKGEKNRLKYWSGGGVRLLSSFTIFDRDMDVL